MNIGILECDKVSAEFFAQHGDYPAMFKSLLRSIDPHLQFTVFDVQRGELPKSLHDVDAYLITGSRHGVHDPLPWIRPLESLLQALYHAQKKVVGICFGHQLIAKSLGGKVIKSPKGWGVGILQNRMLQKKPWMGDAVETINLLASHQDQVVELPPDAELLAGSDFCQNYMMQIGKHFLSVQGHPEFSKDYARSLLISREDKVDHETYAKAMQSFSQQEDSSIMARWMVDFLRAP